MDTKSRQPSEQTEEPSGEDVLVRNLNGELYRLFCERTKTLGVQAESVLTEIVNRGMSEWLRMRSS